MSIMTKQEFMQNFVLRCVQSGCAPDRFDLVSLAERQWGMLQAYDAIHKDNGEQDA